MTRRKENILILTCTLVLVILLTVWRASKLTMQEDTGPLPKGQRSMKPVELYIGADINPTLSDLITAFELAHGVKVKQLNLSESESGNLNALELNSSGLLLMKELQTSKLRSINSSWTETSIPMDQTASSPTAEQLIMFHFPSETADPNVIEVVKYLSGTNQAHYLYSDSPEPTQP